MKENQLNFFGDIREKMFLIIVGLLSIYTIIPLFINQLASIFNSNIIIGYCLFVFLYFLFPLVFYLLYCSIYDYVGFLKLLPQKQYKWVRANRLRQGVIEGLLILLVAFFLLYPGVYVTTIGGLALLGIVIYCFLYCWNRYRFSRESSLNNKEDVIEFRVISGIILAVFILFYVANFPTVKNSFKDFNVTKMDSIKINDTCKLHLERFVDSSEQWKQRFYTRTVQLLAQNPDTVLTIKKIPLDYLDKFRQLYTQFQSVETGDVTAAVGKSDSINMLYATIWEELNKPSQLSEEKISKDTSMVYRVYEMSYYLNQYGKKIEIDKKKQLAKDWKELIVNLQFKGLLWLLTLIIASLCLWLQMQAEYKSREISIKRRWIYKKDLALNLVKEEDNINQIKTFIYISLLLVLPFFKKISDNDIDLNKPFLNTSFGQLVSQGLDQNEKAKINDRNTGTDYDSIEEPLRQILTELRNLSNSEISRHDTILHKFDENKTTVQEVKGQWNPQEK